jgi:hypothetical protein
MGLKKIKIACGRTVSVTFRRWPYPGAGRGAAGQGGKVRAMVGYQQVIHRPNNLT